jgi:hypothetical protein
VNGARIIWSFGKRSGFSQEDIDLLKGSRECYRDKKMYRYVRLDEKILMKNLKDSLICLRGRKIYEFTMKCLEDSLISVFVDEKCMKCLEDSLISIFVCEKCMKYHEKKLTAFQYC